MIVSLKNRRRIYGIEHGRKARNLDKLTRIEILPWFLKFSRYLIVLCILFNVAL